MILSIIIPVYNASQYLRECLDSIVNQIFNAEYEIITVNDGSTDDSLQICEEYASRYPNIKVISEKNAGVSAARNKALAIASGEWLVFVDADDKLLPNALSVLYERAKVTGAELVLANAVKLENGIVSKPFLNLSTVTLPNAICHIKHFALWSYMIPASIVKQHNLRFIEGLAYSEDRIFIYMLAQYCQIIAYTETPVYAYRINPMSVCQSKNGVRKAKHHFIAAYHLFQFAESFHQIDQTIYTHLTKEAIHVIDLGIYLFLQQRPSFKQLCDIKKEYNRLFGIGVKTDMRFFITVVFDYITIQRRRIITFKK